MIRSEIIDNAVIRHYSDQNMMLRQVETDTLWPDAVDILPCAFTYEETDIPVPDAEIDEAEAWELIFGGVT